MIRNAKFSWISILFPLIIFFILATVGLQKQTDTNDEHLHYQYAMNVLNLNTARTPAIQSMMPFSAINLIPLKVGENIAGVIPSPALDFLRSKAAAKSMTVIFSMIVACFVYLWSLQLYGKNAAFFSLIFYSLCPNIIAYSRVITTDVFAAGMIFVSLFFFWRAMNQQTFKYWFQSAIAVGISLLAKYTCLFLFPIFFLAAVASKTPKIFSGGMERPKHLLMIFLKKLAIISALYLIVAILILNAGFLFNKPFSPVGTYQFGNVRNAKRLERYIPFLRSIPIPTPYPYLEGLSTIQEWERKHIGYDPTYLLGKHSKRGFKSYFFYVFLYKVPIAMQIILFLALFKYIFKIKSFSFFRNEVFLFVPITFYMIYLNFLLHAQLGIRYLLPVLPLIHTFSGSLFMNWKEWRLAYKFIIFGLIMFYVVSVLSYSPHFLAYFNEFVGDRKNAYKILGDSNLDWGQSKWYLEQYMKRNPDAMYAPPPVSGKIVISTNLLTGAGGGVGPEAYRWLRENFEPVGHIAYSYLIYNVDAETLRSINKEYR